MTTGVVIVSLAMGCGGDPAPSDDSDADTGAALSPTASESSRATQDKVRVPHVAGLAIAQAVDRLRDSGLRVSTVVKRPSARPRGTVLVQKRNGSSVSLVIAAPFPRVPDTIGGDEASARRALRRAGFEVAKTTQQTDSASPGMVIGQSPSGGTRTKPGATVTITIAKKPPAPPPSAEEDNCTSGYSPCLPPASDYDCAGGSGDGPAYAEGPISVTGSDPYGLDSDSDGVACED